MIEFSPGDLFPLLDPKSHSYKDAQEHSTQVDHHLGFQFQAIEDGLLKSNNYLKSEEPVQTWAGLPVQAMQTPYSEIRTILGLLSPNSNDTVVDLGCSYGRMAHVIGAHYPLVNFIGYELVKERVDEGNRVLRGFDYPRVRLETCDLSSAAFTPPVAEFYFIFDFGSRMAIEKTLEDLRGIARGKDITVVARGRGIRHQIYQDHPWLCEIKTPEVYDHFTIFKS